jgi:hypothetical protein
MVASARDYRWSSAVAHITATDEDELVDMRWWETSAAAEWSQLLGSEDAVATAELRASTYAGRPFGDEVFVKEIGTQFGRGWTRGRPRKNGAAETSAVEARKAQFSLF